MSRSTTFQALVPQIARHVFAGGNHVIDVTGTGTDVGTVVVASRAYISRSAFAYDGMGFYCYEAGGTAPEGEFVRVVKGGFDGTTGTWTISPAWTEAPSATDDFILMRGGLDDGQFLDAVNAVVTSTFWPRYLPFCGALNADDGDMEASGTTSYTAISGPTLAKVTSDVFSGTNALSIATNAADEGVQSAVFGHHEQGPILVYAMIRSSLPGSVILYDETNSTAVRTVTFSANETVSTTADEWTYVIFQAQVPTSSTSLSVRVTTSSSSTATWFIDHMGAMLPDTLFVPPSQITDVSFLDGLMYMPSMRSARDANTFVPNSDFADWPMEQTFKDYAGVNSHRFSMAQNTNRPVWVKFRATETALTGLSSTTIGDTDVIEYGAATELVERWINNLRTPSQELIAKRNKLRAAYRGALRSLEMDRPEPVFEPRRRVAVP